MTRLAVLIGALLFAGSAAAAESLGKLFFTPAERALLDQARAQKQRPTVKIDEPTEPRVEQTSQVLTYSGMVRRSDGKSTLWINNRPVDEKEALSGLALSGRVRSDGAVTVRVPQTGRTVDLKVGQSVELNSGTVAEGPRIATPVPVPAPKSTAAPDSPVPATGERDAGAAPKPDILPREDPQRIR